MDLWGENGRPAMHALHFGYPIGAMIGPLIAYPFVSDSTNDTTSDNATTDILPITEDDSSLFNDGSQIEIAFSIVAGLNILIAAIFLLFQFILPSKRMISYQQKHGFDWKTVFSPSKWAGGDFRFGVAMLICMMMFYVLQKITIKGSSAFYVTYAVDSGLGFSNQQATLFSFVTNLAGTVGRGLAIFFANCVSVEAMLLTEVLCQSISAILTLIWGLNGKLEFIIFNSLFALFRDPIWPNAYAFTDKYISLYAVVVGLIGIANKLADILFTWLLGYLYEYTVRESLFYNSAVASVVLFLHIVGVTIFATRHGNRYTAVATSD